MTKSRLLIKIGNVYRRNKGLEIRDSCMRLRNEGLRSVMSCSVHFLDRPISEMITLCKREGDFRQFSSLFESSSYAPHRIVSLVYHIMSSQFCVAMLSILNARHIRYIPIAVMYSLTTSDILSSLPSHYFRLLPLLSFFPSLAPC